MSKPRTLLGAVSASGQVIVSAGVIILVYRYVNMTVGLDRFGVWSGLMAVSALANLGECGLGGAALRFVARTRAFDQPRRTALVVETSVLTVLATTVLASLVTWPIAYVALAGVFGAGGKAYVAEARAVLPVVLLVPIASALSNVVLSSLDGLEQVHRRSVLALSGTAVLAVAAWVLVPRLGLAGLALAQILQATTAAGLGWRLLRQRVPNLPMIPRHWVRPVARDAVRFGLGWQAVGWASLLMDPLAKVLAIRFGGVAFGGHFEFALRVAPQVRSVISSAQQAFTPMLTRLSAQSADRLSDVYTVSMRVTTALILLAQPFLYIGAPVIAQVWMGEATPEVTALLRLVLMVGFINLIGNPAYFEAAGRGDLRPNLAAHLVMALVNATLAWPLGHLFGGLGVAASYAAGLATGALLLAAWHGWKHRIRWTSWLGAPELRFAAIAGAGVALAMQQAWHPAWLALTGVIIATAAGWGLWSHPLRRRYLA